MNLKSQLQEQYGAESLLPACKAFIETTFPQLKQQQSKPRDLDSLVREARIKVATISTGKYDGKFEVDRLGNPVVTLSTTANRVRQRFTLAHEIGHWLLRESKAGRALGIDLCASAPNSGASREEEEVADLLAAELLMPASGVLDRIRFNQLSLVLIRGIARRFDVSFRAALRRVADLAEINFLYLNVVPRFFKDVTAYAEVDDALFITPMQPIRKDRRGTTLLKPYCFRDIQLAKRVRLGVKNSNQRVIAAFEVQSNSMPIPNCDLLAPVSGRDFVGAAYIN